MKEKYYTPDAEEFCIGSTYYMPISGSNNLIKVIIQSFNHYEENFDIEDDKFTPPKDAVMKLLDEGDIESLGFYKHHNTYYSNSDAYGIEIMDDNTVLIFKNQSIGNVDLFYGTIKNKLELEVILKRIGIN